MLSPEILTSFGHLVLRQMAFGFSVLFLLLATFTYVKVRHWGWLLVALFIYLYCLHPFFLAELFWAFNVRPYWFDYPYYIERNKIFYTAWLLHALFATLYQCTVLFLVRREEKKAIFIGKEVRSFNSWPLLMGLVAFLWFVVLWFPWIKASLENCTSLYMTFKKGEALLHGYYPFSRILLSFAGLAMSYQFYHALGDISEKRHFHFLHLISICGALGLFMLATLLGDKLALFTGMLFSIVLASFEQRRVIGFILVFTMASVLLNWISIVRSHSSLIFCEQAENNHPVLEESVFNEKLLSNIKADGFPKYENVLRGGLGLLDHGEFVTAFSTYALLNRRVPLTYGDSVIFFLYSLPPKFLGLPRPENPQDYFARNTGMSELVGWGLNYFTDWMMNFGVLGGVLGAVLLGGLHAMSFRYSRTGLLGKILFSSFVATLPFFLRSGMHFKEPIQYFFCAIILFKSESQISLWCKSLSASFFLRFKFLKYNKA